MMQAINLRKYYTAATAEIKARGENVRPTDVLSSEGCLDESRKVAGRKPAHT